MTKKEKLEIANLTAEIVLAKINTGALRIMAWDIFSTLGLEALQEVVNQGNLNRKEVGHSDYMNLGEFYEQKLRGQAIDNIKRILDKLTEIHPQKMKKII